MDFDTSLNRTKNPDARIKSEKNFLCPDPRAQVGKQQKLTCFFNHRNCPQKNLAQGALACFARDEVIPGPCCPAMMPGQKNNEPKTPKNMNGQLNAWKCLSSSVEVGVLTEGWNLEKPVAAGHEGARVFRYPVYFDAPFASTPLVHIGLTAFDMDQRDSNRLSLRATEISPTGFVAELWTWRDSRMYSAGFSWLAIGL